MADKPNNFSSFAAGLKQKLIDELSSISEKYRGDTSGKGGEKLREEKLAVLKKYDQQSEAASEILAQLGTDMVATQKFADKGVRRLDQLLVSPEAWSFDDISELAAKFGPLPKGYCYRYLAPETDAVPREVANNANNIIRLPSALNLVVDAHFLFPGDEFPGRSLHDWLLTKPAETNRLWTLRVLSLLGIVSIHDVPEGELVVAPSVGESSKQVSDDPRVHELIEDFEGNAILHYDGEAEENDTDAMGGIWGKRDDVKELDELGARAALRPLLDHKDSAVRVSAATYLLRTMPQTALRVLDRLAVTWPGKEDEKHSRSAALHAIQTLWMYDDGSLEA